jgi:ankyrin repeat protein
LPPLKGHTDTVNALAGTYNANVEAVNHYGGTALMLAAGNGHTDTVNALAGTHNANVDAADQHGQTALMLAALMDYTDTVNALRRHGPSIADYDITDLLGDLMRDLMMNGSTDLLGDLD